MTEPQIDLAHLARLAGLEAPEDEARLRAQLARVLVYVAQLESLQLEDDHEDEGGAAVGDLRPDEVHGGFEPEQALSVAVERDGEFFRVPPVMPQRSH